MKQLVVLLLFALSINYACSYRILCAYPTMSRSHFIVVDALMKGLAEKGHDVTVISAYPPDKVIPNYRHVMHEMQSSHSENMKAFTDNPGEVGVSKNVITGMIETMMNESHAMIVNPNVQKIMNEESFDLLVIEFMGEQHIGLAAHFNCPVILFSSIKASYRVLEMMGNPLGLSYVQHPVFRLGNLNGFKERTFNFIFYLIEKCMLPYFIGIYRDFHDNHFPAPKYPPYDEIFKKHVSAVFVADHFSQGDVRPLVPGIVEISGIQMTDTPARLPADLQTWFDEAPNGVIYFSLGSNMQVSSLAKEKLDAIVNTLNQINMHILWKSDISSIPGLKSTVRLDNWIPQIDVLQHPKLRLFITHGGYGSITEAKFYGIPLLVIPFFADQIPNSDIVQQEGWGIKLPYAEFTQEKFMSTIKELIENPKYLEQAKYESMLYRDRPLTPLKNGIFWVEYILRHKGAKHMQSNARELNFFQLHSLDVIAFLLVIMLLGMYVSYRVLKWLIKKLCGSKKLKKQ